MFFRKAALAQIGGFDPQFTAAGDDVDVCWRMIDAGFSLGYCPAAFVWHFRRNTVKAYYGQQRGYGKAEAMLYLKYPDRFNSLGQVKWRGTIPSIARTFLGSGPMRARWARRSGEMQQLEAGSLNLACVLPLTAEWNLAALTLLSVAMMIGITPIPALVMIAAGPLWALYYAWRTKIEKCHDRVLSRLLVAFLAWTGPMERTYARWRYRASAKNIALDQAPRQRASVQWLRRTVRLAYWNENYTIREALLEKAGRLFAQMGHPPVAGQGWQDIDLAVTPDRWVRIELKTADEQHPGAKVKTMVATRIRLSGLARAGLGLAAGAAIAAAALGAGNAAAVMTALFFGGALCAASEAITAGRLAYRVIEQSAAELGLSPLGKPVRSRARAATVQPLPQLESTTQAEMAALRLP
jgi:hypothetical protein